MFTSSNLKSFTASFNHVCLHIPEVGNIFTLVSYHFFHGFIEGYINKKKTILHNIIPTILLQFLTII